MATKLQLKAQVDSLRNENQRLEELLQEYESLRTVPPERERAKQLEQLQERASVAEAQAKQFAEEAGKADERTREVEAQAGQFAQEAETARERARVAETQTEQMAAETERTRERERAVELQLKQLAVKTEITKERAKVAEREAERLAELLARAETERVRAMSIQQAEWEAGEQQLQAQIGTSERRLQEPLSELPEKTWETGPKPHGGMGLRKSLSGLYLERQPEEASGDGQHLRPRETSAYREGRKSPPLLIPWQTSTRLEQYPQMVDQPQRGVELPHQMPDGLPRSRGLELPPRVSAGVPGAAVPHQMPDGLPRSRGLELPPRVSAGVPGAAVPHQMPDGLPRSRGLELPPRESAGVPGAAVAYRMHYQPQRGQEPYTHRWHLVNNHGEDWSSTTTRCISR